MIVEDYKGVRCYGENGMRYPSVHAVLNLLLPSDPAWMDDDALAMGTECHAVMACYLDGEGLSCYGEAQFRTDAAKHWYDEQKCKAILVEQSCVSRYGFAGRPDCGVEIKGVKWLIDWKFAEAVTLANRIQVETAYTRFAEYKGFHPMIVQVKKSGDVIVHKLKVNHHHWSAFLSATNVLKWRLANV